MLLPHHDPGRSGFPLATPVVFATHGILVITPSPSSLFEVPAQGLLPENLNFIR